jgi:receptor protein-tyrosine kinase
MTRLSEALERAQLVPKYEADPALADGEADAKTPEAPSRLGRFVSDGDVVRQGDKAAPAPPVEADVAAYKFGKRAGDKVVVGANADQALVEQYRRLGAVLHHAQLQQGDRSVMIASAVAAEGKTLTATNLALTLSHSYERRVLLIDADLRRPSVHEVFQLSNRVGLSTSLRHPEGGQLPVQHVLPRLWILPAGPPDRDPMSSLVSETMKQILVDATDQFDWVIVDTPPVALMPDANLLAGMIDTALLVVSANSTPYPLVKRATESIGAARILGVVFNRAEKSALADGYGSYGYYYKHYGEAQEPPKQSRFRFLAKKQEQG